MAIGFIEIALHPKTEDEFFSVMKDHVKNMHHITGRHDIIIEIDYKNIREVLSILEYIEKLNYVIRARHITVTQRIKDDLVRVETIPSSDRAAIYRNHLCVFVGINLKPGADRWHHEVKRLPEVKRLFLTKGPYHALAVVVGRNMEEITETLERIRELRDVKNTETFFILASERRDVYG